MSKAVIVGLSSLLVVGLVVAVVFGVATDWGKTKDEDGVNTSTKAVQAVCQPTDYKEACFKSMSNVNTDDPKELVKAAFVSAKNEIITNVGKSKLLKDLEKNPETAEAVKDCRELFQDSIDDLERSFNEIGSFEWEKMNQLMGNLKSWLSATITYQETCLDGFENTTGNASVKVRKLLKTSMQMSSNGLAIVTDLSSLLSNFDFSSFSRRRLLSVPIDHDSRGMHHKEIEKRFWQSEIGKNRRLLKDSDDTGGDKSLLPDEESDQRKRKLLSTKLDNVVPDWLQGSRRELLGPINILEDLKAKANVVVAQDGSGKYKTIEDALKDVPKMSKDPFIIYIKEGVYNEYLTVLKWMQRLVFVGDGPTKTRITNNQNFADGTKTFKTATLSVLGDFFIGKDIGIENSAGAIKHQAVALRVQSDQSIFFNCHMDGYQDTLYAHTYRQYYRDCRITGTIDFIFGDAASFFQNCTFVVRKPLDNQRCIVTAQGRMERHQPTGIIIHRSRFQGEPDYMLVKDKNQAFLGRPWKEYSKTVIMESYIDSMIAPEGWLPWEGNFGLDTCYYGEYMNEGPGSGTTQRVKWRGIKTIAHARADKFMPHLLFETDDWIVDSNVPYDPDLFAPAPGPFGATGEDEDPNAPTTQPTGEEEDSTFSSSSSSGSSDSSKGSSAKGSSSNSHSSGSSDHSSSSSPSSSGSSSGSNSNSSPSGSSSNGSSSGSNSNSGSSSNGSSSGSSSGSNSNSGSSSNGSSSGSSSGSNSNSLSSGGSDSNSSSSGSSSDGSNSSTNSSSSSSTSPPGPMTGQTNTTAGAPTSVLAPEPALLSIPAPAPSLFLAPAPSLLLTPTPAPIESSIPSPQSSVITSPSSSAQAPTQVMTSNLKTDISLSSTTSESPEKTKIGPVSMKELERMLMANGGIKEIPSLWFILAPTPGPTDSQLAPSQSTTPLTNSSAQVPTQSMSLTPKQNKIGSVSMKELERMLMANEEIEDGQEEEELNDDMSGNIPDGDEASPATIQPPSPAPAPAPGSESITPIMSPSDDEIDDWLPPATTPEPEPEPDKVEPSDKVPHVSTPPKSNTAYRSKYEFLGILMGLAIWLL